jgi:hypothetical protein
MHHALAAGFGNKTFGVAWVVRIARKVSADNRDADLRIRKRERLADAARRAGDQRDFSAL